jgi:hypothetical protein
MGPLWQVLQRGFLLFANKRPPQSERVFFAALSCEHTLKGGSVARQVGFGSGDKEGAVLDQAIKNDESTRIVYLERENARLQRLVAELLVKNEQLRQMSEPPSTVAD